MAAGLFFGGPFTNFGYLGLKPRHGQPKLFGGYDSVAWSRKTVSNGSKTHCMKTWNPINNKKFETLSYLPPLSEDSIAKEIDYMLKKGWIPCLEFDEVGYVHRNNSRIPGYYDGRYWTLWKLPMFGCNDASQVLNEIHECKKTYPNAYIRCLAFDNQHQINHEREGCAYRYDIHLIHLNTKDIIFKGAATHPPRLFLIQPRHIGVWTFLFNWLLSFPTISYLLSN